ncbi:MAG: hypothetical protein M3294_00625 [Pseudomonadota bacterium]|nr:hypothetical protein [Pseudomonadota bacterium]
MAQGRKTGYRTSRTANRKTQAVIDRLEALGCDSIEGMQGLNITPEQLRQELEAGGDLPDLFSGALTPTALRPRPRHWC